MARGPSFAIWLRVCVALLLATLSAPVAIPVATPAAAQVTGPPIPCGGTYVVRPGDSLGEISVRAYGLGRFPTMLAVNADVVGRNPNLLEIGTVLRIPCLTDTGEVVPETAPTPEPSAEPSTEPSLEQPLPPTGRLAVVAAGEPALATLAEGLAADIAASVAQSAVFAPSLETAILDALGAELTLLPLEAVAARDPLLALPLLPLTGGGAEATAAAAWTVLSEEGLDAPGAVIEGARLFGILAGPPRPIWGPVNSGATAADPTALPLPPQRAFASFGAAAERQFPAEGAAARQPSVALSLPIFAAFVSERVLEGASEEGRARLLGFGGRSLARRSALWAADEATRRAALVAAGLDLAPLDPELEAALTEAARIRWQGWLRSAEAAGLEGFAILTRYTALTGG